MGVYTPAGSTLEKQLVDHDDPGLQFLLEVFSGHGNAEQYRDWRAVRFGPDGEAYCPEPQSNYLPACWRAGEIIAQRCRDEGGGAEECASRAERARSYYLALGISGFLTVPGARAEDWLDAGQCQDCYLPAYHYRPGGSAQYALALSHFGAPGTPPRRFRFGLMAASDNHTARPGTGYKEFARHNMTEVSGAAAPGIGGQAFDINVARREVSAAPLAPGAALEGISALRALEVERLGSFFVTGGLTAVHAPSRSREAIWGAMKRREVYGTSGDRILLWFDLENGPEGKAVMGSQVAMRSAPALHGARGGGV